MSKSDLYVRDFQSNNYKLKIFISFFIQSLIVLSWWEHPNQVCIPRKDFKKACVQSRECLEVSGLECDSQLQYCDCADDQNK